AVIAVSVCEQAEVAYPYISKGQYMQKEPPDKFVGFQGHRFLPVAIAIIPPQEGDITILASEDAVIADAGKYENTFLEAIFEEVKELAPEQGRLEVYGKKKSLPA